MTVGGEEAMDTRLLRPLGDGLTKRRQEARSILWMDVSYPEIGRDQLHGRITEEPLRAATDEGQPEGLGVRRPYDDAVDSLHQSSVALLARDSELLLPELVLPAQGRRIPFGLLALPIEVHEDADLPAHDRHIEGLDQVVDSA